MIRKFLIANWDDADRRDRMAVAKLDSAMVCVGGFPLGGKKGEQGVVYRVEFRSELPSDDEILSAFADNGFEVKPID